MADFSDISGGYGLYLRNMTKYSEKYTAIPYEYGEQYEVQKEDMITMQLDLTRDKGILSVEFHAKLKPNELNIAMSNVFDEIDVNEAWRAAVAFGFASDNVFLLPFNL